MLKRIDILEHLLDILIRDEAVAEILIIDNTDNKGAQYLKDKHDKITVYSFGENVYVNPAWNFGVDQATQDYICLCNDDVLLPEFIFSIISQAPIENYGVLGAFEQMVQPIDNFDKYGIQNFYLVESDARWNAFGIFMVMHKSHYKMIPDGLNLYCGDDFTFHMLRVQGFQNAMFAIPIKTEMSSTSNDPQFDEVKIADLRFYENVKKHYRL